jgi:hypothetical protein
MFIQAITSKLLQKLNNNTQEVTFRGGSLLQVANDRFEFKTYLNYYTEQVVEYIPVMFDYLSSPKNIPNKEVYDYTVDITFALTGENEAELEGQRVAIDEFRASLINAPIDTLTVGEATRNIVTSATDLSLTRDVVIVNAKKRILVSMQVFVQSGIDIMFGNNRVVEIKKNAEGTTFEQIFPFDFNIIMQKFTDAEMEFGKDSVESIARNRATTFNLRMFHEDTPLIREIIKDLYGGIDLGLTYKLRFKVPNNNQTFAGGTNGLTVILTDGSINTSFGTQNTLDLNFRLAYE